MKIFLSEFKRRISNKRSEKSPKQNFQPLTDDAWVWHVRSCPSAGSPESRSQDGVSSGAQCCQLAAVLICQICAWVAMVIDHTQILTVAYNSGLVVQWDCGLYNVNIHIYIRSWKRHCIKNSVQIILLFTKALANREIAKSQIKFIIIKSISDHIYKIRGIENYNCYY